MGIAEIIAGSVLIAASLVIILIVLAQDSKDDGLTSAIGGGYNSSFFEGNKSRTKDAKLSKFTKAAAVLLFIVTLALNVIISFSNK